MGGPLSIRSPKMKRNLQFDLLNLFSISIPIVKLRLTIVIVRSTVANWVGSDPTAWIVCGVGSVDNRPTCFEIDVPCSAQYKLRLWYQAVSHANVDNKFRDSDSRQACLLLRSPPLTEALIGRSDPLDMCPRLPTGCVAAHRLRIKIRPPTSSRWARAKVCGPIVGGLPTSQAIRAVQSDQESSTPARNWEWS